MVFTSDNGPTHGGSDPRWHIGGAGCTFFNSAGGLRGFKGSCYEGGIRIPCVVRWPNHVAAGSTSSLPSYFPDWYPTICQAAGVDLPTAQSLDGVDLLPELTGGTTPVRREPMYWDFHDYGGIVAIRDAEWKAIRRNTLKKQPASWELYNLETDPGEKSDLAAAHPEIVQRLEASFIATRTIEPDFPVPLYDALTSDKNVE